ncbi:DNA internalization-related competence protein ComEC/Rec2 [Alteromonas ponticola]|uniref:DNA internalization-related competence protein ComEC/Rec2 n=1 Tax=Alteromonas aquimaris TaxID=2998417 RepID=A0ABT3P738_9ALTE|nr:DNA internalization-related competence protein ComEC/Rec2 [Alteromonas aquimaris]MCW8108582.1 DNA internalization-related competence protein ComEC/Rec2 [Alteromonas aquimaris]
MQNIARWLIGFCAGALSATVWPVLPSLPSCLLFFVISSASLFILKRPIYACVPFFGLKRFQINHGLVNMVLVCVHGLALGTIWMASVGHWYTSWQHTVSKYQHDVILSGKIISTSSEDAIGKITMEVDFIDNKPTLFAPNVLLYWYKPGIRLRRHQQVTLKAKLKPAYGLANPGSALKQQWLLSQAIVATGNITQPDHIRVIAPSFSLHSRLSEFLSQPYFENGRWLKALLIGNRDEISRQDWEILQLTGTAHLFSISGLHMGVIFAWCYGSLAALLTLIQKCAFPTSPRFNLTTCLLWPLIIFTGGYAVLATSALPVIRAWLLISLYLLLQTTRISWGRLDKALIMVASCIVIFPFSLFSASFYLSVGAVMTIWFLLWRFNVVTTRMGDKIKQLLIMQFCLCGLMLPLTILWFGQFSWVAPVANLLLVPLISFTLPFFLLALVIDYFNDFAEQGLLRIADQMMTWIFELMSYIATFAIANDSLSVPLAAVIFLLLCVVLIFLPPVPYKKTVQIVCLFPSLSLLIPPSANNWKLHVFDVGQGTSLAISRGEEAVLFDTGAGIQGRFSMMRNTVIPALRALNIQRVETLFISHSDNDHAGGKEDFVHYFAQQNGNQPTIYSSQSGCIAGEQWLWRGLSIEALWPHAPASRGNNFSCVLKISDTQYTVLIPGDIESTAEYGMLYQHRDLRSDILIAPHHGSATSSTQIFVNSVSPRWVIHTTGFRNRWGFPADEVISRYKRAGSKQLNTAAHGYLQIVLDKREMRVKNFRDNFHKRWYLQQSDEEMPISIPLMY